MADTLATSGPIVGFYGAQTDDRKDPDGPLEQNIGQMRTSLVPALTRLNAGGRSLGVKARLERLFRCVLSRHVCADAATDRPWMNAFRRVWLELGRVYGVEPPTLAYHCWCAKCSAEQVVAPVKSLSLCGRCKIAACACAASRAALIAQTRPPNVCVGPLRSLPATRLTPRSDWPQHKLECPLLRTLA